MRLRDEADDSAAVSSGQEYRLLGMMVHQSGATKLTG